MRGSAGRGRRWAGLPLAAASAGAVLVTVGVLQLVPHPGATGAALVPDAAAAQPTADRFVVERPAPVAVRAPRPRPTVAAAPRTAPVAAPDRLVIARIGVDTRLVRLGLNADRSLEVPTSYAHAGWYARGAAPGQRGPAVLVGHLDSVDGPAVFHRLEELETGDAVQVRRADSSVATFRVHRVDQFRKDAFPTAQVYGEVDRPELRLITCGGAFDENSRHYRDNVVVFAHQV